MGQRGLLLGAPLCGWACFFLGLLRMFAATLYRNAAGSADSAPFVAIEATLFAIGLILTYQAYRPSPPT